MFVLEKTIGATAADQVLLHLVNRMRPCVRRGEREAVAEAFLRAQLQSVIGGVADIVAKFDGAEVRVGNDTRRKSVGVEVLLVQVTENRKVSAFGADVFGGDQHLPRQLPLDAEVPLVHFRLHVVGIYSAEANSGQV